MKQDLAGRVASPFLFLGKLLAWDAEAWGKVRAFVFPPVKGLREAMREARAEVRRERPGPPPPMRPPSPPAPPAKRSEYSRNCRICGKEMPLVDVTDLRSICSVGCLIALSGGTMTHEQAFSFTTTARKLDRISPKPEPEFSFGKDLDALEAEMFPKAPPKPTPPPLKHLREGEIPKRPKPPLNVRCWR